MLCSLFCAALTAFLFLIAPFTAAGILPAPVRGVPWSRRRACLEGWQSLTHARAADARSGLPPDIEPGIPPLTGNLLELSNLTDRNYRGLGWGIDGPGSSIAVAWRRNF